MDPKELEQPTAEELAAEQEAANLPKEDEVRAAIIDEFGFDETDDAEKIDKLVKKEMDHRTKLSTAIGQKIKHRTTAQELAKQVTPKPEAKPQEQQPAAPVLTPREQYALTQAQVHIDDLDEVLNYAKYRNIDVETALKDPTLVSILATKAETRRTEEAMQAGKGNGRGAQEPSDDDVLRKAQETGEVPDTTEGLQALHRARINRKVKGNKR